MRCTSILRAALGAVAAAALVIGCSTEDASTGLVEADYTTCANHHTCESCASGMACFWAGGCCVPLSVNDRFPNGGAVAGSNYAAHPQECASYASVNGPNSTTQQQGTCGTPNNPRDPSPSEPEPERWTCPGTTLTVSTNTLLEPVTTGDERYGCFGLDVLVGVKKREPGGYFYEPIDKVFFTLCADASCAPTDDLPGEWLTRGGSFMRINPGYHNQSPRSRLLLTASSHSGKPVKICYRNLHDC